MRLWLGHINFDESAIIARFETQSALRITSSGIMQSAVKRVAVDSSSVVSVGYDPKHFILEIEFRSGAVYRYLDVPAAAHRLLLNAPSIGEFVNTVVKPRFEVQRV